MDGFAKYSGHRTRGGLGRRKFMRAGLSALIVVQLLVVVFVPMPESVVVRAVGPWLQAYVNFFEFSATWNFFAPDPGPPPLFLEWETEDSSGNKIAEGKWPEFPNPYFITDRQSRRVAMARFVVTTDEVAEKVMVPWLCRAENGGAGVHGVRLWKTALKVPKLEDFVKQGRKPASETERRDSHFVLHAFCSEPHQGDDKSLASVEAQP